MEKNYDVEELAAIIGRERYVSEFRDVPTFEACCRQCPNYANRWGCPPFDHDTLQDLVAFEKVYDLMWPELERVNKRLLELEKVSRGMAFGFVGKCPHCKGAPCARTSGKPCRHPELVRPSLEAYGFNVSLTASEVLGIDMLWGSAGTMPPYLTLVCGLFFNGPDLQW